MSMQTVDAKNGALGLKHVCGECQSRFYDFNRTEIKCPKCGSPPKSKQPAAKTYTEIEERVVAFDKDRRSSEDDDEDDNDEEEDDDGLVLDEDEDEDDDDDEEDLDDGDYLETDFESDDEDLEEGYLEEE